MVLFDYQQERVDERASKIDMLWIGTYKLRANTVKFEESIRKKSGAKRRKEEVC